MDIAWADWFGLAVRWLHFTAGIAWIGSSFYFIALDLGLRNRGGLPEGAHGDSWHVHGGGFYHIRKFLVAPERMPAELHWHKWEAYTTWASGFVLLAALYYIGAESYLIDPDVWPLAPWQAILISLAFLAAGWVVYDVACRSPLGRNMAFLTLCVFVLLVAATWGLTQVFSARAAFLHVGAITGTIMTGNVFFVIIPNQRKVVADLIAGRTPAPALGAQAKQRSTHNNYLTLPVLLMMISNHYPVLYNKAPGWLAIALILLAGGIVRDFFNSRHEGKSGGRILWQWPAAALLMLGLIVAASIDNRPVAAEDLEVSAGEAMGIIGIRCASCHAARPSDPDFEEPPGGLTFADQAAVGRHAPRILAQSVTSNAMPLGNKTGMTQEERQRLGWWLMNGMPAGDTQ